MTFSRERQGDLFILGSATLWGLFPVITILSYHTVSPLLSLAISSLFAAIFFAALIAYKKNWHELRNHAALKNILLATLFTGILYYLLIFLGLQFTTAGNASIVSLTEIFLPLIILSMNPSCSNSKRCFDAACCDLCMLFPSVDVVIEMKLFFAPFDKSSVSVTKCWIFSSVMV